MTAADGPSTSSLDGSRDTLPGIPRVTDAVIREARGRPGGWVYAVDPMFAPGAAAPGHAVVGAWKVDDLGRVSGEFTANPKYRPSPVALGMRSPRSELERSLQLAATGYLALDDAARLLLSSAVHGFGRPGGGLFVTAAATGPFGPAGRAGAAGGVVQVFTDPDDVRRLGWPDVATVEPGDLVDLVPEDGEVIVNPGIEPTLRWSREELVRVAGLAGT